MAVAERAAPSVARSSRGTGSRTSRPAASRGASAPRRGGRRPCRPAPPRRPGARRRARRPARRPSGSRRRRPSRAGTTSGRAWSECGATNVVAIASIPHISTGPPFERLYAVEPEGVEQMIPSHGTLPRSSPPTAHSSSTIRPSIADVTTTSLTATCAASPFSTSSVGSSTTSSSPRNARVEADLELLRLHRAEEARRARS